MDPTWQCRPAVTFTSPGLLDRTFGSRTTGEQASPDNVSRVVGSTGRYGLSCTYYVRHMICPVAFVFVILVQNLSFLDLLRCQTYALDFAKHSGTSRRIQNMGFVRDRAAEGLWMTLNGGAMQMSTTLPEGTNDAVFSDTAIKSGGYGIIDVAWKVGIGYLKSGVLGAI